MDIFISEEEVVANGLDSYQLLLCCMEDYLPSEYLFGSLLLYIPKSTHNFLTALRTLEFNENQTLVCYDNSNYSEAALVYLLLISMGLKCRILIRSPLFVQHLVVLSGVPQEIKNDISKLRHMNNKHIKISSSLKSSEKTFLTLQVHTLPFSVTDNHGKLLSPDLMKAYLRASGFQLPQESSLITGRRSALAVVCMRYIGNFNGILVIDEEHVFDKDKKYYESLFEDSSYNSNHFNHDIVYSNSMLVANTRKCSTSRANIPRKSGCSNCSVF